MEDVVAVHDAHEERNAPKLAARMVEITSRNVGRIAERIVANELEARVSASAISTRKARQLTPICLQFRPFKHCKSRLRVLQIVPKNGG